MMKNTPIDGSIQKEVPTSLRTSVLKLAYYSSASGQPGKRWIYLSLRGELYCLYLINYVYKEVNNCTECPRMDTKLSHKRKAELFSPPDPLEAVFINILRSSTRNKVGFNFS